jgi:hypothetical protein
MAGVTDAVVDRARGLLRAEQPATDVRSSETLARTAFERTEPGRNLTDGSGAPGGASDRQARVCRRLLDLDIATMTPVEALTTLSEMQRRLEDSDG